MRASFGTDREGFSAAQDAGRMRGMPRRGHQVGRAPRMPLRSCRMLRFIAGQACDASFQGDAASGDALDHARPELGLVLRARDDGDTGLVIAAPPTRPRRSNPFSMLVR